MRKYRLNGSYQLGERSDPKLLLEDEVGETPASIEILREFLQTEAAAEILDISPRTLERFRREGRGPPYCKFGRVVRYPRGGLKKWAEEQMRSSTSETAGGTR
jgi:hypothetical protein